MFIVLTMQNCPSCTNTKRLLAQKGIQFREVDVSTEEGKALVKQYKVLSAGTIISEEDAKVVKLASLLEG